MENYLTFSIAGETCAVGVIDVEAVLEDTKFGRISGAPEFVAGLLDLRGQAIPVIDVRKKLRLEAKPDAANGCIIVLSILGKDGKRKPVGALVDSVSEVIELDEAAIAPAGDFAVAFDESVVKGIAKGDSGFITIVAAERMFEAPSVGSTASP
jgi:purine-binding chemotaxis protein CheW